MLVTVRRSRGLRIGRAKEKVMLRIKCHTLAMLSAVALCAAPVLADPPAKAGAGKKHADSKQHDDRGSERRDGGREHADKNTHARFEDRDRVVVREYYVKEYQRGHCPPGLARKHNGCMPPGQAKKWRIGHPLPREVIFYDLPPKLVVEIGVPPPGYRYVRVASDILLIAVGTGMVLDAIQDLGSM